MRIKNKEIARRRHRKEQTLKQAKRDKTFLDIKETVVLSETGKVEAKIHDAAPKEAKKSEKKAPAKSTETAKKTPAKAKKSAE